MKKAKRNEAIEETCNCLLKEFIGDKTLPEFIDIEKFAQKKLGYNIVYEYFSGKDTEALGFTSDGENAIEVLRNGKIVSVVYPAKNIIIEKFLLDSDKDAARRFTIAHEVGHVIANKLYDDPICGYHHSDDDIPDMDFAKIKQCLSYRETRANKIAAALLMPDFLIAAHLKKEGYKHKIKLYGSELFSKEDQQKLQNMAYRMRVSLAALRFRLKDLDCIQSCEMKDYIANGINWEE